MTTAINAENIITDIVTEVEELLKADTITNDNAIELVSIAANKVHDKWGGLMVYIPKDRARWRSVRDKKIKADFTGKNVPELAMKYQLSLQAIYKILKAK